MFDLKGSKNLLSSNEDKPIFEDLEGSRPRPRPRTLKTVLEDVLEAKDILKAATSDFDRYHRLGFMLISSSS